MIRWYRKLFVSGKIDDIDAVRTKIEEGKDPGVFVISISSNDIEQLDIMHSRELKKKAVRSRCGMIVGVCKERTECFELVAGLAQLAIEKTGKCDIRGYLCSTENGDA